MRQLLNKSNDPFFNLALEEYLITHTDPDSEWFMLWQNRPAIIIGRHQNTAEEINLDYVRRENIAVVRRISGGGAVYHDLGNLNFSFITKKTSKAHDFEWFAQPVIQALAALSIRAESSGRNDITIDGKKFSGNAQYIHKNRLLHHGTLLFDTDLERMNAALNVDPAKIASKGVKSVRSRVTNIASHLPNADNIESFKSVLSEAIRNYWPEENARGLSYVEEQAVRELADQKYRGWEWTYAQSPQYNLRRSHRYPWGQIDVRLEIKSGRISGCKIYGDFFAIQDIGSLEQTLEGTPFNREDLAKRLKAIEINKYIAEMDFNHWLSLLLMGNEEL